VKCWTCKQAMFRSSLPHPRSDYAYASYDVGDGCDMPYLVLGVDLLSERSDVTVLLLMLIILLPDHAATQYNRLLPSYCHESVCPSFRGAVHCGA